MAATSVSCEWSVRCFLDRLGSREPAPGGGSAAALSAALGCALGLMVAAILLSRPKIRAAERSALQLQSRKLKKVERELRSLIREDAQAYQRLLQAQKNGRGLRQARRDALACPTRIAEASAEGILLLKGLARRIGPYLGSDVEAGLSLLQGALGAAKAMVEVNQK